MVIQFCPTKKTHTWGPDIGAGFSAAGIGLIDMVGNLDAEYEYELFCRLNRYSGACKSGCSLPCSTKYTDMDGSWRCVDDEAKGFARRWRNSH